MTTRGSLWGLAVTFYVICWAVVIGVGLYILVGLAWDGFGLSEMLDMDDDVLYMALPLGAVIGAFAGAWLREERSAYWALLIFGAVVLIAGVVGLLLHTTPAPIPASQVIDDEVVAPWHGPFRAMAVDGLAALLTSAIGYLMWRIRGSPASTPRGRSRTAR